MGYHRRQVTQTSTCSAPNHLAREDLSLVDLLASDPKEKVFLVCGEFCAKARDDEFERLPLPCAILFLAFDNI